MYLQKQQQTLCQIIIGFFIKNVDFLPTTKKLIDHKHGDKIWRYAVHFDISLPEKNPTYSQMESFLEKINIFYEEANDDLTKCLLSFLKVHCLFLNFVIL